MKIIKTPSTITRKSGGKINPENTPMQNDVATAPHSLYFSIYPLLNSLQIQSLYKHNIQKRKSCYHFVLQFIFLTYNSIINPSGETKCVKNDLF